MSEKRLDEYLLLIVLTVVTAVCMGALYGQACGWLAFGISLVLTGFGLWGRYWK